MIETCISLHSSLNRAMEYHTNGPEFESYWRKGFLLENLITFLTIGKDFDLQWWYEQENFQNTLSAKMHCGVPATSNTDPGNIDRLLLPQLKSQESNLKINISTPKLVKGQIYIFFLW